MEEINTENAAVLAWAKEHLVDAKSIPLTAPEAGGAQVLVVPKGSEIVNAKKFLDDARSAPERREGRAALLTTDSLIEHVNRFKNDDSVLFAEPKADGPRITCVLDYHQKGADGAPRFGKHRSVLTLELSEAWRAWLGAHGREMNSKQFATFLESRVEDVVDPAGLADDSPTRLLAEKLMVPLAPPATVLVAARRLSLRVTRDVKDVVNLETGEVNVQFEEKHENRGAVKAPAAFAIAIPVFRGGQPTYVAVRLSYTLHEASVVWTLRLYRTDKVFDAAFAEACATAKEKTGLPLLVGSPE